MGVKHRELSPSNDQQTGRTLDIRLPVALAAPTLLFALSNGGFAAATIAKPGSDDPATIIGTIFDESGRPAENATVFVYSASLKKGYAIVCPTCWIDCGKPTESNAQGQFAIMGLNPSLKFRLLVLKAGYAATAIGGVDPAQGTMDPIELKPRATSPEESEIVHGRITDASGSPVAGALIEPIEVFEPGGSYSIGAISWIDPLAATDASGNFEIVASRPVKKIALKVSPRALAAQIVTGLPGPATNSVVLTEGATVMGRLVEPSGKPIANAEIVMISHTDHLEQSFGDMHVGTDQDGSFAFTNVPARSIWGIYPATESWRGRNLTAGLRLIETIADRQVVDLGKVTLRPGIFRQRQG